MHFLPAPLLFNRLRVVLSGMLSVSEASMARVNILKRIKVDGRWKMVSIPRTVHKFDLVEIT